MAVFQSAPLGFSDRQQSAFMVRLAPQLVQALLKAHDNEEPCSIRFGGDGKFMVRK